MEVATEPARDARLRPIDLDVLRAAESIGIPDDEPLSVREIVAVLGCTRDQAERSRRRLRRAGRWRWADGIAGSPTREVGPDQVARAERLLLGPGAGRIRPEYQEIAEVFAAQAARKIGRRRSDDFLAATLSALWEAALAFDPESGAEFKTFAIWRVRGAVADEFRRVCGNGFGGGILAARRREPPPIPVSLASTIDHRRPLSLGDTLVDDGRPVEDVVAARDEAESLVRSLPPRHAEAMRHLYLGDGRPTFREVGERMGLSESRVSQLHGQAVGYLADTLRARGCDVPDAFTPPRRSMPG